MRKKTGLFLVFFFLIGLTANAIVYVDQNSAGPTHDGSSWANAHNSITAGLNDADALTTDIWVAEGLYSETINIITSSIEIYGGFEGYLGAQETERNQRNWVNNISTIDGNNTHRVVNIDSVTSTVLDGFTILNGYTSFEGGGIRCWGLDNSNIIRNCIVTNNQAGTGGGINCAYSSHQIVNCTISYNQSDLGGGIYCTEASPLILNCVFHDNIGDIRGGALRCYESSPQVVNCTFSLNQSGVGGGIASMYNGNTQVINCIFEENTGYAILEMDSSGDITPINNLFYNNPNGAFSDADTMTYQDSQMNLLNQNIPEATGNIYGDPAFLNKTQRDFHLLPCYSAALDEGTSMSAPLFDRDGNPRPIDYPGIGIDGTGEGFDIGAYEAQQISPLIDVTPTYLNFGPQYVNQGPSSPLSIEISNFGDAPLVFNSFDFTPDFYIAPNQDTSPLEICFSRTIDIVFDPSSVGLITGTLDILTNDPISSTITVDLEGEGVNNPPEAVKCDENYILDFKQTYDRVIIPNAQNFPTTEFTVSCWLNTSNYRDAGIFSYAVGTAGLDNELLLYFYSQYYMRILIKNTTVSTGISFKDGLWHHLAVTWRSSDGRMIVYKDGQDVYSTTVRTGSTLTGNGTIVFAEDQDSVGGGFSSAQAYIGLLDEMRLWNRVRSKEEIQLDMYRRLYGDETGLVSYWNFDEGSGSTAYDSTASGNDGTLSGLPDWISDASPIYIDYTIDENTDTTVTLCGLDPDADPLTGVITQLPITGTGELYQFAGPGPIRGVLIDTVPATLTDPDMRLVFAPEDTPFNYNSIVKGKVNDGFGDSPNEITYTIRVLDNDPPILINNVPQNLAKGDTLLYTSPTLYATDFEDLPENIIYTLTNPPMHGTLWVNGTDLEQDDIFSQADIDAGMLSYVHSSIGMAPDFFNFNLTDSANLVTGPYTSTIDIIFTPAPQVYVDLNSPDPILDGGSWASAHHSVAIGVLDAEALGLTEIWVANGTYMEEVDMRSYTQALAGFEGYGGAEETMENQRNWTGNICIVEGPEHGRAFTIDDITSSVVHGFVVTGSGISCGGSDEDNLIAQCIIRENTAQFGGGIFMNGASVQITECTIIDNEATRQGGGIYMRNNSQPLIKNCVISGNTAEEEGGAFYCRNKEEPRIVNCIIAGNAATHGGAMYVRQNSSPLLINCTVSGNSASEAGGGVFCDNDGTPIASNTIFEDNDNFAIYEGDDKANASVMNCLFWENPDGAFYNSDGAEYMDNEMADLNNDIPEAMNNITGDPWFVDKPVGDFHLRACSAALDEGIPNQAPLDDKDGNIRPYDLPGIGIDGLGEGFDIGAYELYTTGTKILVTPVILEFGNKLVNQGATDPQTVTILNEGIEILEIDSIEITGSDAFLLTAPPDETAMAICEQRELEVVFDPSEIGPTTGTLVIRSSDPANPEVIVTLTGTGINTPPVAGLPVPGGDHFAMTTDEDTAKVIILSGYDVDGDDITAWVSQIPDLGKGAIHQYKGPGAIPGPRITSVPTQVTDPDWRLVYVPDGASAQYTAIMKWKMNDGYADSLNRGTFTITVLADDDPAVLVNSSMTVEEGATEVVTPADLLATGDYPVSYRIDSLPSFGEIQLNSAPLAINDIFMQDDIALGFVAYAHDGSEEASDAFGFSFKDMNSDWITTNTFHITVLPVNDPPVLAWNRSLLVDEGGIGAILQGHLLVEDPDNTPSEIVYTVGTFPVNGDLLIDSVVMVSGVNDTFTQADIDAGLLSYMHNGGNMDPDEFTFTFTDGEYVLGPETFTITISFPDRKGAWWLMR